VLVQVWVEWKEYTPVVEESDEHGDDEEEVELTPKDTLKRTAALAELLKLPKPNDFYHSNPSRIFRRLAHGPEEMVRMGV
jgi:hypothetical protein